MMGRIEHALGRIRRGLSRSHWLTRLMRLPVSEGEDTRPGLVFIQIDGLSHPQLVRGLERGELPFLKRLLEREHYRLHNQYSGLPAATPAAQAELFYGIRSAVPAFAFRDPDTRQIIRMYEPDAATRVEERLEQETSESLLRGGSVYADNFTGGAQEAHFCPTSLGWGSALRNANPLTLGIFLLSNLYSFIRIAVLLGLELILALVDLIRGISHGRDFIKELKFVPTRAAICILMRELCVIGGKIDIHRGLPVIHINFLGYDEQAHRRGPASLFAHWTLKGIDNAIARLWRTAHRSPRRNYEVWIYSDHGQYEALPYERLQGYSIQTAVERAWASLADSTPLSAGHHTESIQTHRVRLLGGKRFQRIFSVATSAEHLTSDNDHTQVASLGPVGHIYPTRKLTTQQRQQLARELVQQHRVPVALIVEAPGVLHAWTATSEFELPEQTAELVGPGHPFLEEIRKDLVSLCQHPDAGDIVILGWHHGVKPVTFALENGSHAGVSPDETQAFSLLPEDAPLPVQPGNHLRHSDLREAALQLLGRRPREQRPRSRRKPSRQQALRIMTYNVHSCLGMDGKRDSHRIARVIARYRPDVVAMQELDVGRNRSGGEDQAEQIARYLEMDYHFHPAMHIEGEKYGDAILSHLPMQLIKADSLPAPSPDSTLEPRGALWVTVEVNGITVNIINTHLGLSASERILQVEALLGDEWLNHPRCRSPVVLCGDFNAMPTSRVYRLLRNRLDDSQVRMPTRAKGTFYSRFPTVRIDHIFIDRETEVTAIEVPRSRLLQLASDHLPLLAELSIQSDAFEATVRNKDTA